MAIPKEAKELFEALVDAAANGALGLMEVLHKDTKEVRYAFVIKVQEGGGKIGVYPVGILDHDGRIPKEYEPPNAGVPGGFGGIPVEPGPKKPGENN